VLQDSSSNFAAVLLMIGGVLNIIYGCGTGGHRNGSGGGLEGGDVAVGCDRAHKRVSGFEGGARPCDGAEVGEHDVQQLLVAVKRRPC
jgi:hypothetical protein